MDDWNADEARLLLIERKVNHLADLIEVLAKERHARLGHARPFGEFGDRNKSPDLRCDDPVCREMYDEANLERL